MKKFIPLIVILAVLISCHEEDDFMPDENKSNSNKVLSKMQDNDDLMNYETASAKDSTNSTSNPPVKEGEHWRHSD